MNLETDGSATAQPDAGTPDVATSTGVDGGSPSSAATADPFSGLDSGTLEWIGKAGIKDVGSLAAKARNAESLIGNSVRVPDDKATPEELDKFYSKLGRPEKPDGYEFKLPEGLPEDSPYDAEFAGEFKTWAHEAGLSAKQAQDLHDKFVAKTSGLTKQQMEAGATAQAERMTKTTEALEGLWKGPADSEQFKTKLADMSRAVRGLGGDDLIAELQSNGLIGPDTEILSPLLADALAKAGAALFKEDSLEGGTAGMADNPFADGKHNLTEQMRTFRTDPDRARRLIAAAGKTPRDFGLT